MIYPIEGMNRLNNKFGSVWTGASVNIDVRQYRKYSCTASLQ